MLIARQLECKDTPQHSEMCHTIVSVDGPVWEMLDACYVCYAVFQSKLDCSCVDVVCSCVDDVSTSPSERATGITSVPLQFLLQRSICNLKRRMEYSDYERGFKKLPSAGMWWGTKTLLRLFKNLLQMVSAPIHHLVQMTYFFNVRNETSCLL